MATAVTRAVSRDDSAFANGIFDTSIVPEAVCFLGWVGKPKGRSLADRLLIISTYHVTVAADGMISGKSIGKCAHIFELRKIISSAPTQLTLEFVDFRFDFVTAQVDQIIAELYKNYARQTVGWPGNITCSLDVHGRVIAALDTPLGQGSPLCGMIATYDSACAYLDIPADDEFQRLLSRYASTGERALNLNEALLNNNKKFNLKQVVFALKHNTWFDSVSLSDVLARDAIASFASAIRFNRTLTAVALHDLACNMGFARFGEALAQNEHCHLTSVDLSGNAIREKDMPQLATGLASILLKSLDLSDCDISPRATTALFTGLARSKRADVTSLNFSGNRLETKGTEALVAFMRSRAAAGLVTLILSRTLTDLSLLASAFSDSLTKLLSLDISHTHISDRDSMALANALRPTPLTDLDVSHASISIDALVNLLVAMVSEKTREQAMLSLNGINLEEHSRKFLTVFQRTESNVHTLAMEHTNLGGEGLHALLNTLKASTTLRTLNLSCNIKKVNEQSDAAVKTLAAIVASAPLEVLDLGGNSKQFLGAQIVPVLQSVALSRTLTELHVAGNKYGDAGNAVLAASLAQNRSLTLLSCDRNGISFDGMRALADGVKQSLLCVFVLPIDDLREIHRRITKAAKVVLSDTIKEMQVTLRTNRVNASTAKAMAAASAASAASAPSGRQRVSAATPLAASSPSAAPTSPPVATAAGAPDRSSTQLTTMRGTSVPPQDAAAARAVTEFAVRAPVPTAAAASPSRRATPAVSVTSVGGTTVPEKYIPPPPPLPMFGDDWVEGGTNSLMRERQRSVTANRMAMGSITNDTQRARTSIYSATPVNAFSAQLMRRGSSAARPPEQAAMTSETLEKLISESEPPTTLAAPAPAVVAGRRKSIHTVVEEEEDESRPPTVIAGMNTSVDETPTENTLDDDLGEDFVDDYHTDGLEELDPPSDDELTANQVMDITDAMLKELKVPDSEIKSTRLSMNSNNEAELAKVVEELNSEMENAQLPAPVPPPPTQPPPPNLPPPPLMPPPPNFPPPPTGGMGTPPPPDGPPPPSSGGAQLTQAQRRRSGGMDKNMKGRLAAANGGPVPIGQRRGTFGNAPAANEAMLIRKMAARNAALATGAALPPQSALPPGMDSELVHTRIRRSSFGAAVMRGEVKVQELDALEATLDKHMNEILGD